MHNPDNNGICGTVNAIQKDECRKCGLGLPGFGSSQEATQYFDFIRVVHFDNRVPAPWFCTVCKTDNWASSKKCSTKKDGKECPGKLGELGEMFKTGFKYYNSFGYDKRAPGSTASASENMLPPGQS
jgi:hypothetical protein